MNAQERLFTAISGGKPDRVPVVPKMWVDLAAAILGVDLKEIVTSPETALNVMIGAGLACGFDAVRMWHFPAKKIHEQNGRVIELDGRGARRGEVDMPGGLVTRLDDPAMFILEDPHMMAHHHYWTCEKPIINDIADAGRMYVPTRADYERLGWAERMRAQQRRAGDNLGIIGDCDSPTLAFYISFRGMDNALVDLLEQPALVEAVMDKGVEIAIERARFNLDLGLKILRLNDSAGNMSVISPAMWRRFIKPRFKRFCDEVHAHDPDARVYCHICGNVMPIIEDLLETGLDCIAPLDPLGGVTAARVREAVGARASLMGGVNTLSFINSTPAQIIEEARRCIDGAGAAGGYVLGSGCVVPRSARRENLAALVEAAAIHGNYGATA
ncbi:MAG: hypothetical protein LBC18_08835 [Opitutaceae bacterium]|jgi:uroporphyrinogen-III decarboxylase|nr:hypothetical protein [Opitutaceae bacterium]